MGVSMNELAAYSQRMDARPQPSDKFTVTLTRSHLEWLRNIIGLQVRTERAQLDYYIKRDAAKHPERKTIEKFRNRLQIALDFQQAIDKAKRNYNG